MTARKSKAKADAEPDNALRVKQAEGESPKLATAKALVDPATLNGIAVANVLSAQLGEIKSPPGIADYAAALDDISEKAAKGDLAFASRMLAVQAMTLDTVFADMIRRMAHNAGQYLGATETYARIALKAQAGSRAALSELAKLHQPREQTVRHVHVNEGGQAVIADEFHHHGGGAGSGNRDGQPHATGTGAAGASAALSGPDPLGQGVPIPGGEGEPAMQDARRQGKRRA